MAELENLRRARDEADIAECLRVKALGNVTFTHAEVMAEFGIDDAAAT